MEPVRSYTNGKTAWIINQDMIILEVPKDYGKVFPINIWTGKQYEPVEYDYYRKEDMGIGFSADNEILACTQSGWGGINVTNLPKNHTKKFPMTYIVFFDISKDGSKVLCGAGSSYPHELDIEQNLLIEKRSPPPKSPLFSNDYHKSAKYRENGDITIGANRAVYIDGKSILPREYSVEYFYFSQDEQRLFMINSFYETCSVWEKKEKGWELLRGYEKNARVTFSKNYTVVCTLKQTYINGVFIPELQGMTKVLFTSDEKFAIAQTRTKVFVYNSEDLVFRQFTQFVTKSLSHPLKDPRLFSRIAESFFVYES